MLFRYAIIDSEGYVVDKFRTLAQAERYQPTYDVELGYAKIIDLKTHKKGLRL